MPPPLSIGASHPGFIGTAPPPAACSAASHTAQIRADGVGDDDADLALPIWAGVIPVQTTIGAITDSPHLPAGVPRPADIAAYTAGARLDDVITAMHRACATD